MEKKEKNGIFIFGESQKLYPMERVFCIHIIKNHFFCLLSEHFLKKSHKPLTDGHSFLLYIHAFLVSTYMCLKPTKANKESISNWMRDIQNWIISCFFLIFPCSLFSSCPSYLLSLSRSLRPCVWLTQLVLNFCKLLYST